MDIKIYTRDLVNKSTARTTPTVVSATTMSPLIRRNESHETPTPPPSVAGVTSLNNLKDDITLKEGEGIKINTSDGIIVITNTGVISLDGLSGKIETANGNGIDISIDNKKLKITNTGVLSVKGNVNGSTELTGNIKFYEAPNSNMKVTTSKSGIWIGAYWT